MLAIGMAASCNDFTRCICSALPEGKWLTGSLRAGFFRVERPSHSDLPPRGCCQCVTDNSVNSDRSVELAGATVIPDKWISEQPYPVTPGEPKTSWEFRQGSIAKTGPLAVHFFGWLRLVRAMKAADSKGINQVDSATAVVKKRIIRTFRFPQATHPGQPNRINKCRSSWLGTTQPGLPFFPTG